jgi:2-dehydro-3-deoxygluconokinase
MKKIFCFGELLIRLSPSLGDDWQEKPMPFFIGGAELNVSHALSKWGLPVKYFTALPDNYLSRQICGGLEKEGIDTSSILFEGDRIGVYFLPQGADLKQAGVIYDRARSAFAELKPGMIDWEKALKDSDWFHFSAICPALSQQAAIVCLEALNAANKMGIPASIDLNFRQKLWQARNPLDCMPELAAHCEVIMGNIWSAATLLGTSLDPKIEAYGSRQAYLQHAGKTAIEIQRKFPICRTVANTFRFNRSENAIQYYASLFQDGVGYDSIEWRGNNIVDRVGTGDCFMAGLIYGLRIGLSAQEIIEFAASAAFGKFFEKGDASCQSGESIQKRIKDHG